MPAVGGTGHIAEVRAAKRGPRGEFVALVVVSGFSRTCRVNFDMNDLYSVAMMTPRMNE